MATRQGQIRIDRKRLTTRKMTSQVLGVQVFLGAVRARELTLSIPGEYSSVLYSGSTSSESSRVARRAGKDGPAALIANNVARMLGHVLGSERLITM